MVELPNIGFEAGVIEPAGAALVLPNRFVVAAGLLPFPNSPPPPVDAGVLDAVGVPKLNVGVDDAAGALVVVVPELPNNPPLDGAVPNEKPVELGAELDGMPELPKLPNGFDMLTDVYRL